MSANTPEWAVQIQQSIHQLDTKLDQLLHHLQQLTAAATHPQPAPSKHPTFCGYPCTWDINDAGWPSHIYLEDGTRAAHREKQGDHWYSVNLGDGTYGDHFLKIRRPSPPEGALVIPSPQLSNPVQEPAPDPDKETALHQLHTLGRNLHRDEWPQIGPQLVHTHTNGRTDKSTDMQPAELTALINALQKET